MLLRRIGEALGLIKPKKMKKSPETRKSALQVNTQVRRINPAGASSGVASSGAASSGTSGGGLQVDSSSSRPSALLPPRPAHPSSIATDSTTLLPGQWREESKPFLRGEHKDAPAADDNSEQSPLTGSMRAARMQRRAGGGGFSSGFSSLQSSSSLPFVSTGGTPSMSPENSPRSGFGDEDNIDYSLSGNRDAGLLSPEESAPAPEQSREASFSGQRVGAGERSRSVSSLFEHTPRSRSRDDSVFPDAPNVSRGDTPNGVEEEDGNDTAAPPPSPRSSKGRGGV